MKADCTSNLLRAFLPALFLLLLSDLNCLSAAQNLPFNSKRFHPGRILVQPRQDIDLQKLAGYSLNAGQLRKVRRLSPQSGVQVMELEPGETVEQAILKLRKSGLVHYAEPDYLIKLHAAPDDPEFTSGNLWAFHNTGQNGGLSGSDISALEGWDTSNSASNIIVAVIDTGVRYTHQDLAPNIWVNPREIPGNQLDDDRNGFVDDVHGINASEDTSDPNDSSGHGTHVAGILGAVGNNGMGVCGVAWSVKIMPIAFFDAKGFGSTSDAIQSIDYAVANGAHIINASWGSSDNSLTLQAAIERARNAGVIFVTSAGNESSNNDLLPVYPANYPVDNIVVVAGTNRRDELDLGYSNYGAETVDLAAPGTMIYSTWANWDGSYTYLSGTSMAAPFVSGALALLKARFPEDNAQKLIERLYAATDPLESLRGYCKTAGRLNLSKALGASILASFDADHYHGFFPFDVSFTNKTFGSFTQLHWDFGDGSTSTEPHPKHQFGPGAFQVTLSVTNESGQSSSFTRTIHSRLGYTVTQEQGGWATAEDIHISLGDNGISPAITLPFEFSFFNQAYSQIFVSANGLAGFRQENLGTRLFTALPSLGSPDALLAPYWDDLDPTAAGSVFYGTRGESPNRRFVVTWKGVRKVGTSLDLTFQLVLEESSDDIVFNYEKVAAHDPAGGGRQARIGLENETGTLAIPYAQLGQPRVLADGDSVRFTPSRTGFLQVKKPAKNKFEIAQGTIRPLAPLEFELSNTGAGSLDWAIQNVPSWIQLTALQGTLSPGASTTVSVALGDSAFSLPLGLTEGSLTIQNTTSAYGSTGWNIQLDVYQALRLKPYFAGGELQFPLEAAAGLSYVTESSTDLLQWVPVVTNTIPTSGQILLHAPIIEPYRFFRIRQQE